VSDVVLPLSGEQVTGGLIVLGVVGLLHATRNSPASRMLTANTFQTTFALCSMIILPSAFPYHPVLVALLGVLATGNKLLLTIEQASEHLSYSL
jgi:hypothetical protein